MKDDKSKNFKKFMFKLKKNFIHLLTKLEDLRNSKQKQYYLTHFQAKAKLFKF